ncbi:hypothetical protein C8J57DRAFT_1268767 [Mycena rebaudengoi]|nr:hypothetical protein C8J57DRAFT_1268767 [Mycena rebaudengoi]
MRSDGYFDDDDLDDAVFEQLDEIEAAHTAPPLRESSFDSDDFTLDTFIEDSYQGKAQPVAGPSKPAAFGSRQTTLFGAVLSPSAPKAPARAPIQRTKSTPRNPFGQQAPKTKKWDHTAFAKSGQRRGKGKDKVTYDDEHEEEEVEFEQFPAPFISRIPPPPMKLKPDLLEAKHWIYPLNQPKRDYQYNIVKHCLFENTIVALPTGLGKTFIAGVVMLNFYRWFPDGKIVFVAPTKPLVAQQIDASHKTCGIPGDHAIELTGANPKPMRARAWKEKRVFYMTPQTLNNDLVSENCDAKDIVLLVIDEAHRATGGYAYNTVVRYMMAKNPHFRILALTATPGSTPDAVQALIDGLHISHIEIRDENSLDLKAYIHHKKVEQHIIQMSADVNKVKDPLVKLMNTILKPLENRGVMHNQNPVHMHPYAAQAKMGQLKPDQKWSYTALAKLSSLARAMSYLIEGTIGMCNTYMQELARDKEDAGKKAPKGKPLRDDPLFQSVQRLHGFSMHPKMDRMKALVVQHFAENLGEDGNEPEETRVMVFVTFREAVDEIPLIRANKFIGQGTDKQGKKGLAQKQQLEIIKQFKAGEFNVLVATSIGEEGLDIGEVDLIICYDAQKTPIRMLQRFGRTGRKREGKVHVLLSEGREEHNMDKAKVTYKEVQKTIVRGEQLELYGDVERLLPDHIKPQCLEKQMEIQEYVREDGKKKRSTDPKSSTKGTKRKRNDDMYRNMPDGASTGFVSVAKLLVKGSKKRKVAEPKDFDQAGQDDDTDMEITSGILCLPRRAASSAASTSSAPPKVKSKLRRAATEGSKAKKKTKETPEPTASQFSSKAMDDSGRPGYRTEEGTHEPPTPPRPLPTKNPTTDYVEIDSDSDSHSSLVDKSMAWLIGDSEDDADIEIVDSSPGSIKRGRRSPSPTFSDDSIQAAGKRRAVTQIEPDESVEFVEPLSVLSRSEALEIDVDDSMGLPDQPPVITPACPPTNRKFDMLPPKSTSSSSSASPPPSFPVRPPGKKSRSTNRILEPESPAIELPPPSQRRLQRKLSSSPVQQPRSRSHKSSRRVKPVYDFEAVHSGDEVSEGSSGSEEESESDRQFLQPLPETQMLHDYDQSMMHHGGGPNFANRPARRGMFTGGLSESSRRRPLVSSSPQRPGDESDAYELGTFVVDDDAEISFISSQ